MTNEEMVKQYREEGYVIIKNAIAPVGLERVQKAYETLEAKLEPAWRQSLIDGDVRGGYGNGPNAHTMRPDHKADTVFLELANNPNVVPVLEGVVGPEVQVMEMICHNHHAGTDAHTGWHRDWPPWTHPKYSLKAKCFYFLDDQDEDMGCFSLVPGTHKLAEGPPTKDYRADTLDKMPGLTKMRGKAGDAVLWNVLCWHTGLANTSVKDRRLVIYGYMPFWVKKWIASTPPDHIVEWADTPQKRQMMGIHCVHGRRGWDRQDVDYLPEHEEIAARKNL